MDLEAKMTGKRVDSISMIGMKSFVEKQDLSTSRKEILDLLIKGLQRLEYRGYDSAGVGIDGYNGNGSIEVSKIVMITKQQ